VQKSSNNAGEDLMTQLRWCSVLVDLAFLHTGFHQRVKKDQQDQQLEQIIDKIHGVLSKREDEMKDHLMLAGQVEFLQQNEGVLRQKV
jgi:hypothetical protein